MASWAGEQMWQASGRLTVLVLVPFVVGIVLFAVIRFGVHAPGGAVRRLFVRGHGRPGSRP